MAKGIPVIGRAPDKKAKIINVDELGNLKVSQLESKLDGIENKLVALEQKLTDGSQKVQLSGTIATDLITFHNGSTTPCDGEIFQNNGRYKTLAIQITSGGGNLERKLIFQGRFTGYEWDRILGVTRYSNDVTVATETTNTRMELWLLDITGLDQIRIRLGSINSGLIFVRGKAVV